MKPLNKCFKFKKNALSGGFLSAMVLLGIAACKTEAEAGKASETTKVTQEQKASTVTEAQKASIKARLKAARPNLNISDIAETEVPGVIRVDVMGSGQIYMVQNGDYFFVGDLYKLESTGLVNITDQEKAKVRGPLIASIKPEDTISFKPAGDVKAVINVFTDVDCGYCQKLHREVPKLNDLGIEVRYLAFPRAGIPSPSYDKIASAWCADDPQGALTKVKNRQKIDTNVCEGNPVADQYLLGQKIGVNGTPAIVLQDGELIPGYMPAESLAARIGVIN